MLSVIVITISIFVFLVFVKNLQKTKENFKNKLRENFTNNTSIKNVHVDTEIKENNEESENDEESENNIELENNAESEVNVKEPNNEDINEPKCDGGEKEGECLFGCGDNGVSQYTTPPKPSDTSKPADLKDMLNTFEETEKICEAIERKDKERRERDFIT